MNDLNATPYIRNSLVDIIKRKTGRNVVDISPVGSGAAGSVFRVSFDENKKMMALKISKHTELLFDEYQMLLFLKNNTKAKFPQVYFFEETDGLAVIAMEYLEGISGKDNSFRFLLKRRRLSESIIDNLLVIQQAKNDKFGPYNNAVYDSWQEYYHITADEIYTFSKKMYNEGKLSSEVFKAVELSYSNFDKIFSGEISEPTLIHGDYWMPNFIIDKKEMELIAAVDPFNVLWADSEYELFALTVGVGKRLKLYESYKKKVKVSLNCDLKLEMYALYSELLWYKRLGDISHNYLKKRSKRLIKEMKKRSII